METPHPKAWQGPEARRLLAELQAHPGWHLVLEWLAAAEAQAKHPVPMTPEVGPLWPFRRAWADGEAAAYENLRTMLSIALKFPGKVDARGRLIPSDFEEGEQEDDRAGI